MHTTTIVAPATAPGSALGIIRLSGGDAIGIAEKIFSGKRLSSQPSHTLHFGRIVDNFGFRIVPLSEVEVSDSGLHTENGQDNQDQYVFRAEEYSGSGYPDKSEIRNPKSGIIDEVLVSLFRAPHSFTGENIVEISCHGSSYIMQRILEVCVDAGAIPAKEGEFTQRAFLNGKMDLTQAEAVADLIAAQSKAAQQSAMHQLRGGFSGDLKKMREELIAFSALIELELDFSQEDVEFADRTQLTHLLDRINESTNQLISSFRLGNAVKNGVSVAITGAPNAGKSTLLNALLNEDRAIVSEIAGTTRDTIEEVINIDGILFRFIDTAGIREHTDDAIERQGIERSRKAALGADVVIELIDGSEIIDDKQKTKDDSESIMNYHKNHDDQRSIRVINKADLLKEGNAENDGAIYISAKTGAGIGLLKDHLKAIVGTASIAPGQTIITNTRHLAALQQIQSAVQEIKAGLGQNISGELIALDIRRALDYIGELSGTVYHDKDVLGAIFGKFCIGK